MSNKLPWDTDAVVGDHALETTELEHKKTAVYET